MFKFTSLSLLVPLLVLVSFSLCEEEEEKCVSAEQIGDFLNGILRPLWKELSAVNYEPISVEDDITQQLKLDDCELAHFETGIANFGEFKLLKAPEISCNPSRTEVTIIIGSTDFGAKFTQNSHEEKGTNLTVIFPS